MQALKIKGLGKNYVLIIIVISLSAFTHFWNPIGFPVIHWDEHTYIIRGLYFSEGLSPQMGGLYDHPYFGWIFLGGMSKLLGLSSNINTTETDANDLASLFFIPRVLMGILAVIDTFLVYKIAEKRYNPTIAFIAALFFAVMPLTWLLRRFLLESILLPFTLASFLVSQHIIDSAKRDRYLAVCSGLLLGTAIFTKIPAFTFIPLIAISTFRNSNKNYKILGLWFMSVLLVPALWPAFALYLNQLDMFIDGIIYQNSRKKPGNPFFHIEKALRILFGLDPVLIVLGLVGAIVATLRKDFVFVMWIMPYFIFVLVNGYASAFHFIILFPPLTIAAAVLIYRSISLIRILKLRIIAGMISVFLIGGAGMINTISAITSETGFEYYRPMSHVAKQIQHNGCSIVTLGSDQELFSRPILNGNINYIEGTLAVRGDQGHAGIRWFDGSQEYYVFLREDKISLWSRSYKEFLSSPFDRKLDTLYTIKILYKDNMINIFLNDSLKMQIPSSSNTELSRVGIGSHGTSAQFNPINIGQVSNIPASIATVQFEEKATAGEPLIEQNSTLSKAICYQAAPTSSISSTEYNIMDFVDPHLGTTP
jgi:hypothetical protein